MSKILRNLILLFIVTNCLCTELFAQRNNVNFTITNAVDSLPLASASVVLIRDRDSAFLAFGLTDTTGKFQFKHLKLTSGTSFVISFLGFRPQKIPASASTKQDIYQSVSLHPDTSLLADVLVESGVAVRMNKDTLEYNTDFFKTMPNAVVEELLKKIPGIEFRSNDEIYADGQRVSKITVDGKDFFGSNPKVLLKNLPAELIKKVQIVDEKNTIATETREKADIPKIINLRLKKEVHQGILGKLFAGYGTDKRYETGGLINLFRDTLQVSLIGTSNNQSSEGFSMQDLNEIGGFDRSGGMGGQQGYSLNGYGSNGIPKKSLAGTNINYNFTKDIQLNLQYFYKENETRNTFKGRTAQYLGDTSIVSDYDGKTFEKTPTHQLHGGFTWKQDSTGYFSYSLDLSRNNNNSSQQNSSRASSTNVPLLTQNQSTNSNSTRNNNISTSASYNKTFVKPKIDINLNGNYSQGRANSSEFLQNLTSQYSNNYIPDTLMQYKYSNLPNKNYQLGMQVSKTIHKNHIVIASVNYNYDANNVGGEVYRRNSLQQAYAFIPDQSIGFTQEVNNWTYGTYYRFSDSKHSFNIKTGGKFKVMSLNNLYNVKSISNLNRNYHLFSPEVNINYKTLSFTYSRDLQPPSGYYLSPITDSSNKLYISSGNPNLAPSTSDQLGLRFNKYWVKKQFSIYGNINKTISSNVVVQKREIDQEGVTHASFVNMDDAGRLSANIGVNKGFHKKDFNFNASLSLNGQNNTAPIYVNNIISQNTTSFYSLNLNSSASWKSVLNLNLGVSSSFNRSSSTDTTFKSHNTKTFSSFFNFKWKPSHRAVFQWNNRLNTQPDARPGLPRSWYFSDASIAYSFFKKESMELRLSAYDIFDQNMGIHRYSFQNYVSDYQGLVQKRYFMLTVTYNFKKIGN